MNIKQNLEHLHKRISQSCELSGRDPGSIEILPVTKSKNVDLIKQLQALGFKKFGENYIQEIEKKFPLLPSVDWIAIGHLQTNKSALATRLCHTILSLDSMRLAKSLDKESQRIKKDLTVWIQVDLWEQSPMKGCLRDEVESIMDFVRETPNLCFGGLMILPPIGDSKAFSDSHNFRLEIEQKMQKKVLLSMGMSEDLELAVMSGTDQLRVGSALLGAR